MSEQQTNNQEANQAVFQIQRVYLKDASLEMPHAPQIFLEQQAPSIEISVDVGAAQVAENIFESEVTVTVTSRIADKVAFLVEAKQAAIFEISGVPNEQLDPLLGILCPNMVYPYLRANIADLITRTGFPPVHLADINFEQFYQQRLEQAQQAAQAADEPSGLILPPGHA